MNLRIFDSRDDLIRGTAEVVLQCARGKARCAIALSGGSTPKPLYELLGRSPFREELAPLDLIWVVVDERYVPLNDPQSNAGMIQQTLFARGMSDRHSFLRFRTELGDPAATARAFATEWAELALDRIDCILLGIGDDGHTASLFPGTPVLEVADRPAAEVYVPRLSQWRVTLTLPMIRQAALRMIVAAGSSKRAVVQGVREGVDYPITRAVAGELESWWFLDREAAP